MDIWSNPDNTVIGDRAFGTDAGTVTGAANMAALGLLSEGVIPAAKHFPGHGDTAVDSHYGLPWWTRPWRSWRRGSWCPSARPSTPPASTAPMGMPPSQPSWWPHILMTQLDPDWPASLSHKVVTGLLREELGFDGVVCTDDLTMGALSETWGVGEAAVLAVEAGCDLLLVCHGTDNLTAARDALLEAVDSGRISMERWTRA